jgi:hypothetical protein
MLNPNPPAAAPSRNALARERFDAAFREWLDARAAAYSLKADLTREALDAIGDRVFAAEMALVMTPAPSAPSVMLKIEVVEKVAADEARSGRSEFPFVIVALAAVRADLIAHGFGC